MLGEEDDHVYGVTFRDPLGYERQCTKSVWEENCYAIGLLIFFEATPLQKKFWDPTFELLSVALR